ncbi:metal-dependent hydrolase [Pseudomonas sp. S75]|uniref:metal-dependent hydrolase n=1 Tax=unclassified Pseudomonas TaxID=196821 RepID=UPI001908340E|nr:MULTISPECIES: metal-dependent hydrolase [unclassified Pseudomonas]MBJ9975105.1 metal-dependent hydrolase [Pseudomonas sp. S30]MBK0152942.1 metal-dependent hydrolase [Pseudomonas sp. S75]
MDSITQAVLGAALQGTLLGRLQGRRALAYGAALATVPDLDVVIQYADPVSQMTYHRGFSHSIFVLTGLALLLAWGVGWLTRRRRPEGYSWPRLFIAFWLVLVTHPLLDAFTVYGTQLFWPLTSTPLSWAAVFIIDPIYTLPLLATVGYAAWRGTGTGARRAMAVALIFGTAYLAFGLGARMTVERRFEQALHAQGIASSQVRAVPVAFNSLLWRVLVKTPEGGYYEGIASLFDRQPAPLQSLPRHPELAEALRDAPLHQRLRWFTDDWLRYDVIDGALIVTDLRMGLPGSYNFRFAMAHRDALGQWRVDTPSRWRDMGARSMFDGGDLGLLWRRIFDPTVHLPLQAWAARAQASPPASQAIP